MNWKAIAIVVVAIGAVAVWYGTRTHAPETSVAPPAATTMAPHSGEVMRSDPVAALPPPAIAAPPTLDGSDTEVRAAISDLAPQLLQWLTPAEQIRRWVATVDQLAEGSVSVDRRPLVYALKPFQATRRGDTLLLDTANYDRAKPLIDVLVAIPPEHVARYYRAWQPLLENAYRELGRSGSFDQRLRLALQRVQAVKPLSSLPELAQPSVYFTYADPARESASDLDKLLWRLGPDNAQRLQNYLSQLETWL